VETATVDERAAVSPPPSGKWRVAACLVTFLPAAGAAYGAWSVIQIFRAMALVGSGGIGAVSMGLLEANQLLIAALVAGAVIAGFLAVALATRPARAAAFPGLLFSLLVTVLPCVPVLLLRAAESFLFDIVFVATSRVTGSISDASQHLANLLIGTILSAAAVAGLALVASLMTPIWRASHDARGGPRVAVWVGAAILLLGLAALFYAHSSYLHDVALRGHV